MFLSFLPSWLRVDGITAQLQVSYIYHSFLHQEAKNFTPSKNNVDLPSIVNFAIMIHADQDEKQLIYTTLLLLWLERTLRSNHSKSQVKIDHSVWSTLAS